MGGIVNWQGWLMAICVGGLMIMMIFMGACEPILKGLGATLDGLNQSIEQVKDTEGIQKLTPQ